MEQVLNLFFSNVLKVVVVYEAKVQRMLGEYVLIVCRIINNLVFVLCIM